MSQLELEQETRDVLDRIRHTSNVLSIYEMPADLAEAAVWEIGKVLLDKQNLHLVQYNTYRWFLREMSRLPRTKTGIGSEPEASLPFARELYASRHRPPVPDFSRQTKLVVQR